MFKGLTVSSEAYEKLKALKQPGDSFSTVLLRELPGPAQEEDTAKALRVLGRALKKKKPQTASK